ncbi:hypothetical protein P7K49_000211, partial [Saguinus oedipus]
LPIAGSPPADSLAPPEPLCHPDRALRRNQPAHIPGLGRRATSRPRRSLPGA